jgi:hypothetical protein
MLALLAAIVHSTAAADEMPLRLPDDGWWIRHGYIIKRSGSSEEETVHRTCSMVGTHVESGVTCRWVELQFAERVDGREHSDIIKFLIPEKALLESEHPASHVVRAWRKTDDGSVEQMQFDDAGGIAGYGNEAEIDWGHELVLFPGMQRRAKIVPEKKSVDYQHGRIEVPAGRAGRRTAKWRDNAAGEVYTYELDFTVWNHPTLAPGFAAANEKFRVKRGDALIRSWAREVSVEDFGANAKSAIPDRE